MTHSPLPWRSVKTIDKCSYVEDAENVCVIPDILTDNAEFVLRAVNAHDDLVEALQDLHIESTETYGHWPEMKIQVEAALAKAGA